jgi:hypothetical protein
MFRFFEYCFSIKVSVFWSEIFHDSAGVFERVDIVDEELINLMEDIR